MSRYTSHLSLRVTEGRTKTILKVLMDKHSVETCSHYGEPGYQDPEAGVLFADWNPIPKWVPEYLEQAGYSIEWSDEWYIDYDYNKAYRTSPDCYHWQSQIRFTEHGEILTPDDSIEDWVREHLNNPKLCLPDRFSDGELEGLGFVRFPNEDSRFESGWHPGQNDDPAAIFKVIRDCYADADVVFRLDEVSQFYVKFTAWYRVEDETL